MAEQTSKPLVQSRTFWFNIAIGVAVVIAKAFGYDLSALGVLVGASGNAVLRTMTTQSISGIVKP